MLNPGEKITKHSAYSVSYNHKHMQANWVAYEIKLSNTQGLAERESRFIVDPIILPHTARTEDYTKSGFDRGHLAPAADMKYSSQAMAESFYTSNISPQRPGLNRGIWKLLEEKIRDWAPANHPLFIVTGPVLTDTLTQFIGRYNRISVPKRFYKVVLDTAQPARAIGFVFSNIGSSLPLTHFALSIDAVEKKMAFVRQMKGVLGLPNLTALHARIETLADQYDMVVSRAFASLSDFAKSSGDRVSPRGKLVAMKARPAEQEFSELTSNTTWSVDKIEALHVPELQAQRCLVWLHRSENP